MTAALLTSTALYTAPLAAQTAAPRANNDASPHASPAIDLPTTPDAGDIVVTARRSRETITDTPVAVTAITGSQLQAAGVTDLRSLTNVAPSLYFESQGASRNDRSQNSVVIRGMPVGTTLNLSAERAGVFIDGAPIIGGFIEGVTDVARVEVIRGPQSATFGRSTFAGAINLVTREPANEFRGSVRASYGSYGTTEDQISVEGPIIKDQLSMRVTARYFSTDGQYENTAVPDGRLGARSTKSIALAVSAKPFDALKLRFYGIRWRDKDGSDARGKLRQIDFNCNAGAAATGVRNYICGELSLLPASRLGLNELYSPTVVNEVINPVPGSRLIPRIENFNQSYGLERHAYHFQLNADLALPFAGATLSYLGSKDRNYQVVINDSDAEDTRFITLLANPANPFLPEYENYALRVDFAYDTTYNELRFISDPAEPYRLMIGGSIFDGRRLSSTPGQFASINQTTGVISGGLSSFGFTDSFVNTKAVFGSAAFDYAGFTLSLEGRYQVDKIAQASTTTPPVLPAPLTAEFKRFLPRAILEYKIDPNTNIYASFARGANPGGVNSTVFAQTPENQAIIIAATGVRPVVQEEILDSYEAGLKGRLFGGRLRYALAAYLAYWKNQQVNQTATFTNANGAVSSISAVTNIGLTHLRGVEFEFDGRVNRHLTLSGSFAINANTLKVYNCVPCRTSITGFADVSGNKLARAPRTTAYLSANYENVLSGDWRYFLRSDYSYKDRVYVDETNVAYIGPRNRVNAAIGVRTDAYSLEAFVTNLFDERDYVSAERSTDLVTTFPARSTNANAIIVGLPEKRTFGVRGSLNF